MVIGPREERAVNAAAGKEKVEPNLIKGDATEYYAKKKVLNLTILIMSQTTVLQYRLVL